MVKSLLMRGVLLHASVDDGNTSVAKLGGGKLTQRRSRSCKLRGVQGLELQGMSSSSDVKQVQWTLPLHQSSRGSSLGRHRQRESGPGRERGSKLVTRNKRSRG